MSDLKETMIAVLFVVGIAILAACTLAARLNTSQNASEPVKFERMTPVPVESIKCREVAENGNFCRVYEVYRLTSTE